MYAIRSYYDIIDRREEFSGKTYHFVDPEPVELAQLIFSIKSRLGVKTPKKIFVPYWLAHTGKACIRWMVKKMNRIGIEARIPAELMFIENFYDVITSYSIHYTKLYDQERFDEQSLPDVLVPLPAQIQSRDFRPEGQPHNGHSL